MTGDEAALLTSLRQAANASFRFEASKVVHGLEVQPELGGGVQRLSKQPRGVRRHAPLAAHDFVDALHRDSNVGGEVDLRQTERPQVFGREDYAGMCGN